MEFAQQLFSMLDEEARARLVYKPSKALKGRLNKRLAPFTENNGKDMERFCDVEFVVGDDQTSFHGLRYVFANLSPFFEERLYADGGCSRLELPDVSPTAFQCIFNAAYGVPAPIEVSNVLEVLDVATNLKVDFLAGECLGLLARNINGSNVLEIMTAAIEQNILSVPLELRCCSAILSQSKQVLRSDAFLRLNTELLLKILECDYFKVDEVELWHRLIQWAKTRSAQSADEKSDETPGGWGEEYNVGDTVVLVNGNVGTIKYKGETDFAPGLWLGIDLRDAKGDTSGTVEGKKYFATSRNMGGVMVPPSQIGVKIEGPVPKEQIKIWCVCGGELKQMAASEAYSGGGVNCNICTQSKSGDEVVYHCPRKKIPAHAGGFDMCESCHQKQEAEESKSNEILQPNSRDVQYLRQVMPFIRFPLMPIGFFLHKVAPLLPRPMSDSVLISHISPGRQGMFPSAPRQMWGGKSFEKLPFEVIAASNQMEKARKIPEDQGSAEWSGDTMSSQNMNQWFVMKTESPVTVAAIDVKNRYSDGDTIKSVTLFSFPAGQEFGDGDGDGDKWIQECTFELEKTTEWQNDVTVDTSGASQYWKFKVNNVYGGADNYPCINELHLKGAASGDDELSTGSRMVSQNFTVVAASQAFEKAKLLPSATAAEWSRVKMSDAGGAQWFIIDLQSIQKIHSIELEHFYSDKDTVKDIELYYLPAGLDLRPADKVEEMGNVGENWSKACDLLSAQMTGRQTVECAMADSVEARFWKFRVVSVYGGGLTADNYPCWNYLGVNVEIPMWTTGMAVSVE